MSTDTKIKTLIFNRLTQEQYDTADKVPTEFYLTPDTTDELLAAKQDKLIAGTNITIKDNVISATGGSNGSKRNLGEVYFSQSSLVTDNSGALPGWTGEYYENGKTLFPDLYNFVKVHNELQISKADYDNAIATYGECKKYVVDENEAQTSLRLPKYARSHGTVIKEKKPTTTDATWYRQWSDGWLEQGGTVDTADKTIAFLKPFNDTDYTLIGPGFYIGNAGAQNVTKTTTGFTTTSNTNFTGTHYWEARGQGADGAQENTLYPWISAYTSAIPASVAQAAEFTGALSGKANTDLSNIPMGYDYVIESKFPTADDTSWYRLYKSGWLEQGNVSPAKTGDSSGFTLDTTINFPKPFADNNYTLIGPGFVIVTAGRQDVTKTATGFTTSSVANYCGTSYWYACGIGAK